MCTHSYTYTCMHTYIHACMYIHTYIHVRTYEQIKQEQKLQKGKLHMTTGNSVSAFIGKNNNSMSTKINNIIKIRSCSEETVYPVKDIGNWMLTAIGSAAEDMPRP